jgi:glycosyltransferase involved in cell wall biosynthesis
LPILEAMACRTPVIAAPAGAAPEIVGRGGGYLVPAEDPQAMADRVVEICQMKEGEWRSLSDVALATARAHSWDSAAAAFESTLAQAIRDQA